MIEPIMMRRAFGSEEGFEEMMREDVKGSTLWRTPRVKRYDSRTRNLSSRLRPRELPISDDARRVLENDAERMRANRK